MVRARELGGSWVHKARAMLAVILVLSTGVAGAAFADPDIRRGAGIFGSIEFPGQAPPQWFSVLRKLRTDGPVFAGCAERPEACGRPSVAAWEARLATWRGRDRAAQLDVVNRAVNERTYKTDTENFRSEDYWAGPLTFLARSGDCEDFAIFKMFALERLGFDPAAMRVVIVRDTRHNADHAVLAVADAGRTYILDNNETRLLTDREISHYLPVMSFGRRGSWGHVVPVAVSESARDPRPAGGLGVAGLQ